MQITVINKAEEVKEVLEGDEMVPPSSSIANTSIYIIFYSNSIDACSLSFAHINILPITGVK